jgi:hypothetical protein
VRSALEIFTCRAVNSTSMVSLRFLYFQHSLRLEKYGFYRTSVESGQCTAKRQLFGGD